MAIAFLLDTTVLLHWTRGKELATVIERQFNLMASPLRPLVCEVSLGEMLAFSRNPQWSDAQRKRMNAIHEHATVIDISDRRVLEAYADLSTLAQASGWGIFHGKNDLWVAAAAKVANAQLLTMDKDFLPLRGREGWAVTVLDSKTAISLP
jgi:predicted nucleic acid-binding protein